MGKKSLTGWTYDTPPFCCWTQEWYLDTESKKVKYFPFKTLTDIPTLYSRKSPFASDKNPRKVRITIEEL